MILRILKMEVTGPNELDLKFNNGVRKRVDVSPLLEGPIFQPLRSTKYFARAKLDEECGTVVWPNGADFAPEILHELSECSKKTKRRKQLPVKAGK